MNLYLVENEPGTWIEYGETVSAVMVAESEEALMEEYKGVFPISLRDKLIVSHIGTAAENLQAGVIHKVTMGG